VTIVAIGTEWPLERLPRWPVKTHVGRPHLLVALDELHERPVRKNAFGSPTTLCSTTHDCRIGHVIFFEE
jgi:hypothetical protein